MHEEPTDETSEAGVERTGDPGESSDFEVLAREIEANPGGPSFPRLAEAYRRAGQLERAESIAKQGLSQAPERMSGRVALALAMLDKGDVTQAVHELASIIENIPNLPGGAPHPVSERAAGPAFGEHRLYSEPLAAPSAALPSFEEQVDESADDASADDSGAASVDARGPAGEPEESDRNDSIGNALSQNEIDHAIDSAHAEEDQMVSANRLAEAALREIVDNVADDGDRYSPGDHPVFTTETMAGLLEGQGDREGAERIRASIPGLDVDASLESDLKSTTVPEILKPTQSTSVPVFESDPGAPIQQDAAKLEDAPRVDPKAESRERVIHRLESWIANIRRDVA